MESIFIAEAISKYKYFKKAFPITAWSNCFWRIGHFTKTWKLGDY